MVRPLNPAWAAMRVGWAPYRRGKACDQRERAAVVKAVWEHRNAHAGQTNWAAIATVCERDRRTVKAVFERATGPLGTTHRRFTGGRVNAKRRLGLFDLAYVKVNRNAYPVGCIVRAIFRRCIVWWMGVQRRGAAPFVAGSGQCVAQDTYLGAAPAPACGPGRQRLGKHSVPSHERHFAAYYEEDDSAGESTNRHETPTVSAARASTAVCFIFYHVFFSFLLGPLARQTADKLNPVNVARYMLFMLWMRAVSKHNVVALDEMSINAVGSGRNRGRCAAHVCASRAFMGCACRCAVFFLMR